jgi:hypothetical protein
MANIPHTTVLLIGISDTVPVGSERRYWENKYRYCVPNPFDAQRLPLFNYELYLGFCLAKGISPLLPIFRESILNGAPELKEQAAQACTTESSSHTF